MVFIGFAWFATFLADAGVSLVFTLGNGARVDLPARLRLPGALVSDRAAAEHARPRADRGRGCDRHRGRTRVAACSPTRARRSVRDCPHNAFEIARNDSLANGILQGQRSVGVVLSRVHGCPARAPLATRERSRAARGRARAVGGERDVRRARVLGRQRHLRPPARARGRRGRGSSCSRRFRSRFWPCSCSVGWRAARLPDSWSSSARARRRSTCARRSAERSVIPRSSSRTGFPPALAMSIPGGSPVQLPQPGGERAATRRRAGGRADRGADPRSRARREQRARAVGVRRCRVDARERAPAGRAARAAGRAAGFARAPRRGDRDASGGGSSATCTTAHSSGSSRSR